MNSKFSEFFRLATPGEKERVWKEIIKKVNEEQQAIINQANLMNSNKESFFSKYVLFNIYRLWLMFLGWMVGVKIRVHRVK